MKRNMHANCLPYVSFPHTAWAWVLQLEVEPVATKLLEPEQALVVVASPWHGQAQVAQVVAVEVPLAGLVPVQVLCMAPWLA